MQVWVNVEGSLPLAVIEPGITVTPGQDVRAHGLWLALTEESTGHWSVQLEAFALALDDPDDAWGVPTPLGLDLEWEDDPTPGECLVTGDVLVADRRLQIHARGTRG